MTPVKFTAALAAAGATLALGAAGCGGTSSSDPLAAIGSLDSSWIAGEPSLATSADFLSIASRAQTLAAQRAAERTRELALIEAARLAAKKHQKEAQLRAYLEAKRRAEAAYRAALRKAALERKRQLAKLAELKRQQAEALRKLNAKLRVPPGEECRDPLVRQHVRCQAGRLPTKKK
jgi:hypothetical protein